MAGGTACPATDAAVLRGIYRRGTVGSVSCQAAKPLADAPLGTGRPAFHFFSRGRAAGPVRERNLQLASR